jgi:hypothetical protein
VTLSFAVRARVGSRPGGLELAGCAVLTAAVAALLLLFGPAPGDAAVHLYRTFLVRSGALVWDNFWYEGDYPLASYSLLYYLPAAIVGNVALVLSAAVASTVLFASIVRREWGDAALWPSRAFGICAAAPLFTGEYSFALGFAAMLGAVRALQSRHPGMACLLAALTLGFSPLAFLFLCLVLASALAARRRISPAAAAIGAAIGLLALFEFVVLRLFPSSGFYPVHSVNVASMLGVCVVGALLAGRARADVITAFFVLWGVGGVVAALVPSPIGDNWTRLDEYVFPLMLLAAFLTRFRPRRLVVLALAGALAYNVVPYLLLIPYRLDNRPSEASFWRPSLDYLHAHARPGFRVEVVPTAAHWESYWLARNGFALARGWYRQLDMSDNPILYRPRLSPAAYRHWLRSVAVKYVLLPSTQLDFVAAPQEARLLRSGRSGLNVVFHAADGTIYRLPRPTPLLTGRAPARIVVFSHTTISGVVSSPGTYLLRSHFVPFWNVRGPVCVRAAPGGMTLVDAAGPGRFTLAVGSTGAAVLRAATGGSDRCPEGGSSELAGAGTG